jgi:hypothetical protein
LYNLGLVRHPDGNSSDAKWANGSDLEMSSGTYAALVGIERAYNLGRLGSVVLAVTKVAEPAR